MKYLGTAPGLEGSTALSVSSQTVWCSEWYSYHEHQGLALDVTQITSPPCWPGAKLKEPRGLAKLLYIYHITRVSMQSVEYCTSQMLPARVQYAVLHGTKCNKRFTLLFCSKHVSFQRN